MALDFSVLDNAPAPQEPATYGGEFAKGLRSGFLGAGSQLESFAGGVGAAMGYDEFAANRNRAAAELQREAQAVQPRVTSFRDIGSLRDFGDYAAGLAGQAVPSVAAGVGAGALTAATGGGALAAIGAGALTQLPLETGDVLQRQQLDPNARARSAGENLRDALITGGASAVGQAIVPAALGGKIVGKGVQGALRAGEKEAVKTAGTGITRSMLRDAAIEGASEGGGELVKQQGVGFGATPDFNAALEAGVGGAVVGGGLGAAGHVAERFHQNRSAMAEGARDLVQKGLDVAQRAANPQPNAAESAAIPGDAGPDYAGLKQNVKNVAGDLAGRVDVGGAARNVKNVVTDFASRIKQAATPKSNDEDVVRSEGLSPDELAEAGNPSTPRERALELLNAAGEKGKAAAKRVGEFLSQRANLSAEDRARAQRLVDGVDDAADRAWAATKATAERGADTFMAGVDRVSEALGKAKQQFGEKVAEVKAKGAKKSEDFSGVRQQIVQELMPHLPEGILNNQNSLNKVGEMVRNYIDSVKSGDLDTMQGAAERMQKLFGDETEGLLARIFDRVATSSPEETDRFVKNMGKAQELAARNKNVRSVVEQNLPEHLKANADEMTDGLLAWARGEGRSANDGRMAPLLHKNVRDQITQVFGKNTPKVLKALEGHVMETAPKSIADLEGASEAGTDMDFYGSGKNRQALQVFPSPEAHKARFPEAKESAADRLIRQLSAKHPDREFSFVPLSEAGKQLGWSDERIQAASNGNPDEVGLIASKRVADPDQLSDTQLKSMRLNTSDHANSKSRVDVDGEAYDAVRITKHFLKGDQGSERGDVRLARAFMDGIAALQATAENPVKVADSVVIGTQNGKPMTFGEAKALDPRSGGDKARDRESADVAKQLEELRAEYRATSDPDERDAIRERAQGLLEGVESRKAAEMLLGDEPFVPNDSEILEDNPAPDNVHRAAKEGTLKPVLHNADGTPRVEQRGSTEAGSGRVARDKVLALAERIGKMSSPAASKMAERLRTLAGAVESMSDADRRDLLQLANSSKVSEVTETVNGLARKYKDVIAAPTTTAKEPARAVSSDDLLAAAERAVANSNINEPSSATDTVPLSIGGKEYSVRQIRPGQLEIYDSQGAKVGGTPSPKAQAAKKAALDQAASSSDPALLEELRTTDNAEGLRRTAEYLAENHPDSKAAEVAGEHFDELVQDPDVAYSLATNRDEKLRSWMGESVAVDESGKPLTLYHGTQRDGKGALFFTANPNIANDYAAGNRAGGVDGGNVVPAHVKIEHPVPDHFFGSERDPEDAVYDAEWVAEMKKLGYDGYVYEDKGSFSGELGGTNYVVFDNAQVRSAFSPDVAYSLQTANPANAGPVNRQDVNTYVQRVLGNSVAVAWEQLPHAGEFERDMTGDVIRLSIYALNPKTTAYHEALHGFFQQLRDAGAQRISQVLEKAASQLRVVRWMENFFANEPGVIQQIRTDAEERAAYMYQLWASEPSFRAVLNPQATTIFGKVAEFIRSVLGIWSNDQRALHIMDHFHSGEYAKNVGKPNTVALLGAGTNRGVEYVKGLAQPLAKLGDALFGAGSSRLRDTGIAAFNEIADLIKPEISGSENKGTGYLAASRTEFTQRLNAWAEALGQPTQQQLAEAIEQLQDPSKVASSPEARLIVRETRRVLQELGGPGGYMRNAGVDFGNLGPDYFPRVWSADAISKNQQGFLNMMAPYVASGQYQGDPRDLMRRLIANDGNNFDVDTRQPGMQHTKERELTMLTPDDVAPFLSKDLYQTMSSYISQATRRAEWARRFGGDGKRLDALLKEAERQGATDDQIKMAERYLKGVTGTLGDGINPDARRLIGNAIIYQNIRLLPLAIFSSVVDPMGIVVRGGTISDAWTAFKRGVREIPQNFRKYDPSARDASTLLAETLGVIENAALQHSLGALYSQGMTGSLGRKINDSFFRFNLMEQYNRSMRVGAMEAAMKFIERHAASNTAESKRFMAELSLTPADVRVVNGRLDTSSDKMRDAINKWVDGAVLRPDAADKPIWFNDPHWALVSHLKQFTYAFHHTIIDRVIKEAKEGNYKPAAALAGYVPIMIASDFLKGLVQGGGDQPAWKRDWGPMDYAWSGVQRAGLLGVGQFGADVVGDVNRGGAGFGALVGPTIEQLTDAVQVVGGRERFGQFTMEAMPANALYKNLNVGE